MFRVGYSSIEVASNQRLCFVKVMYLGLLLFSTLSYGSTFQLLYFTLPLSSLCFPILFLLAAILAEVHSLSKTFKFLFITSIVNGIVAFVILGFFHQNMHDFWVAQWEHSSSIYVLLSLGFHLGLLFVLLITYWCRKKLGMFYSFMRVSVAAIVANAIDIVLIWPTMFANSEDTYLSSWKFLTLTTFKINVLLLCLPVAWLVLWVVLRQPKH